MSCARAHITYENVYFSFTISEFGPEPTVNDICQSLWLDHVNIKVYAKFYQNTAEYLRSTP